MKPITSRAIASLALLPLAGAAFGALAQPLHIGATHHVTPGLLFLAPSEAEQRAEPAKIPRIPFSGETSLLGTAEVNATFYVWIYDWESGTFQVVAERTVEPILLKGSSPDFAVWAEHPPRASDDDTATEEPRTPEYFFVRREKDAPSPVQRMPLDPFVHDGVKTVRIEAIVPGTGHVLVQCRPKWDLVLWDVGENRELGRLESEIPWSLNVSPAFGQPRALFVLARYLPVNGYQVRLCRISPFSTRASLLVRGTVRGITSCGPQEVILNVDRWPSPTPEFWRLRLAPVGDAFDLQVTQVIKVPKPEEIGLKPQKPGSQVWQKDYRNGILVWSTWPRGRIIIIPEHRNAGDLPLVIPQEGDTEWSFSLNPTGSRLITPRGGNGFRIWRVQWPRLTLIEECRLTCSPEASGLALQSEKPTDIPAEDGPQ